MNDVVPVMAVSTIPMVKPEQPVLEEVWAGMGDLVMVRKGGLETTCLVNTEDFKEAFDRCMQDLEERKRVASKEGKG